MKNIKLSSIKPTSSTSLINSMSSGLEYFSADYIISKVLFFNQRRERIENLLKLIDEDKKLDTKST